MGRQDLFFFRLRLQSYLWTKRRRRGWGVGSRERSGGGHVLKRGWLEGVAESGQERGKLGGSAGRKGASGLARLGR